MTKELELPGGWRLSCKSELPAHVHDANCPRLALVWERVVDGWRQRLVCELKASWDGPSAAHVEFVGGPDDVGASADGGLPVEVLRAFPLRELKRVARSLMPNAREYFGMGEQPYPVPASCRTELDYALVAAEFARLASVGNRNPIMVISERLGVGRTTISERVRRARKLGLLEGDKASAAAQAIIRQLMEEDDREGK
ncbi:hypothetical protein [Streptomyces sp. HUAS TT7]|uniref:hypothetical protein n=1 Tax=Streptomyces sp. HUAS TT7 TaxID=3447507 RepID=UPI003F6576C3